MTLYPAPITRAEAAATSCIDPKTSTGSQLPQDFRNTYFPGLQTPWSSGWTIRKKVGVKWKFYNICTRVQTMKPTVNSENYLVEKGCQSFQKVINI